MNIQDLDEECLECTYTNTGEIENKCNKCDPGS